MSKYLNFISSSNHPSRAQWKVSHNKYDFTEQKNPQAEEKQRPAQGRTASCVAKLRLKSPFNYTILQQYPFLLWVGKEVMESGNKW